MATLCAGEGGRTSVCATGGVAMTSVCAKGAAEQVRKGGCYCGTGPGGARTRGGRQGGKSRDERKMEEEGGGRRTVKGGRKRATEARAGSCVGEDAGVELGVEEGQIGATQQFGESSDEGGGAAHRLISEETGECRGGRVLQLPDGVRFDVLALGRDRQPSYRGRGERVVSAVLADDRPKGMKQVSSRQGEISVDEEGARFESVGRTFSFLNGVPLHRESSTRRRGCVMGTCCALGATATGGRVEVCASMCLGSMRRRSACDGMWR